MCRTAHAVLSAVICGIQMLVRTFMTTLLMIENIIRMVLQTFYNLISFALQMISLIPICCVFFLTSRLKCFMCGGGGPCPVNRGGACDCLMSVIAIVILFFVFRATGVMDKIFYGLGYMHATTRIVRFVPTPGMITQCSRNDTDTVYVFYGIETTTPIFYDTESDTTSASPPESAWDEMTTPTATKPSPTTAAGTTGTTGTGDTKTTITATTTSKPLRLLRKGNDRDPHNPEWTTILYYLV